jgi:hypothetical protein
LTTDEYTFVPWRYQWALDLGVFGNNTVPAGDTVDLSTGRLMHAVAAFSGPGAVQLCAPPSVKRRLWQIPASRRNSTGSPVDFFWVAMT